MSDAPTVVVSGAEPVIRPGGERFTPGVMVANRYRIVALLGRGGMGEVYRADDIRLDQPVALKFLPPRLESNAEALERLLAEVRLGRLVAHPNVCRLYDLGETDGHHFIAMEYVDGEDLASLLQRIGRLPADKAIDIVRDIAAGLAAAHALGIVHRDLKPSNVMIDGRGRARITDFGLAALGADLTSDGRIVGTPAYMAPEQLAGGTASPRSDVYALGLILFECLTGTSLHGGTSGDEILRRRLRDSGGTMASLPQIDAAVDRLLRRCVEPDPEARPANAQVVLASLPGGDPLAAALAAGETPSPELVAAAEGTALLSLRSAWTLVLAVPVLVALMAVSMGSTVMHRLIRGIRSPDTLAERSAELAAETGYTANADRSLWMHFDLSALAWLRQNFRGARDWSAIVSSRLTPLRSTYRQSSAPMVATNRERRVLENDPPMVVPDMTRVTLDHRGRLVEITAVPPAQVAPAATAPPRWDSLFAAAELPMATFAPAPPVWSPPVASDARYAWTGVLPGTKVPIRVEAASRGGKPVWFAVIPPWRGQPRSGGSAVGAAVGVALEIVIPLVTAVLAFRNLRRGRGDRRGALRLGLFLFLCIAAARLVRAHHVSDGAAELEILTSIIGASLYGGLTIVIAYLGLEPYIRRRDPQALISWVRAVNGRWRDPQVGRDVLIGVVAGCGIVLWWPLTAILQPILGLGTPAPLPTPITPLGGTHHTAYFILDNVRSSASDAIGIAFLFVVFGALLRRRWLTTIATYLMSIAILLRVGGDGGAAQVMYLALAAALVVIVYRTAGVLGIFALAFGGNLLTALPTTIDVSSFYAGRSLVVLSIPIALAVWAFVAALDGRSALGEAAV